MRLGAIILAGGGSSRMGQPKAALPFGDSTLLGRTAETLLTCTFPVVVVTRDDDQAKRELPPIPLEVDLVFDGQEHRGHGPVAGLLAGLAFLEGRCDAAFVIACDVPFLTLPAVEWIAEQLGEHDAVMCKVDGVLQPLAAVYRLRVKDAAAARMAAGNASLQDFAGDIDTRVLSQQEVDAFDPAHLFLRGVNTPDEYEAAQRAAGEA